MLFFSAAVYGQKAPGDESSRCLSTYGPNKVMLMSSRHYEQLLGDSGVWDEKDKDENNEDDLYNPTHVSDSTVPSLCDVLYLHFVM